MILNNNENCPTLIELFNARFIINDEILVIY